MLTCCYIMFKLIRMLILIITSISALHHKLFVTGEEMKTLSPEGELVLKQFNQRMDTWEGRLKSVENNVQEQLNELKIQMSNVIESSSLPTVVDDQDGRMLHYHQIQKRENQQPAVSITTHKPLCVNSSRPCSYYYRDRPDMKKPAMIGKDYCTYLYPDHPDSKVVPLKPTVPLEYSSNTANSSGFNSENSDKNSIKNANMNVVNGFDGLPTNCVELQKIGHSLNGFYLVNEKEAPNKNEFEIAFCRFTEQTNGPKDAKEERFGHLVMNTLESKTEPTSNPTVSTDITTSYKQSLLDSSTSTSLIKKEPQSNCIKLWKFKIGEPLLCLSLERSKKTNKIADRVILDACDINVPEQNWAIIESENGTVMQICLSTLDKCLTVIMEWINNNEIINLTIRNEGEKTQSWKMNVESGQLVNVAVPLCLTGIFRPEGMLSGIMAYSCDKKTEEKTSTKWAIVPIKNC